MPARRDELTRRLNASTAEAIFRYISDGGPCRVDTHHGSDADDNTITFKIQDWDAFIRALESDQIAS